MPDINGTAGNDTIDVTNDSGTLNGTPQGTPIDNIRARNGNDTISVTNSTISGDIRAGGGSDVITVTDSTVVGDIRTGGGGDTLVVQGSTVGNIRLNGGNDTLDFIGSTVLGDIRGGNGTDTLNLPVGTVINDAIFGVINVTSGGGYSLSSGTFTLPSGTVVTYSNLENGSGFPCFTRDTRIATPQGERRVQSLCVADLVLTQDNGPKPIRWIGKRRLSKETLVENERLLPVCISAGALGNGLPKRDLRVSRQHRMVVQSRIAIHMFGLPEVMIPAIKLISLPGIFIDQAVESVEYFHLLLDQHEVIFAESAPTESLFTGPEALKSISPEARREIQEIFPEILDLDYSPKTARFIPAGRKQKQLIKRHRKHERLLLEATALS